MEIGIDSFAAILPDPTGADWSSVPTLLNAELRGIHRRARFRRIRR